MNLKQFLSIISLISFSLFCSKENFLNQKQAKETITEAYIWGYPLAATVRTGKVISHFTPINTFLRMSNLATSKFKAVVTPNVDTLYASAWLDLAKGTLILTVPAIKDRYYSVQFLDAYTNSFAYVGTRATGTQVGKYLIVGPSSQKNLPSGIPTIKAPTNNVWLIVRVEVKGIDNLTQAHALLQKITLSPLQGKGTPIFSKLPKGLPLAIPKAGIEFFDELGEAVKDNPPSDKELLKQFESVGIGLGRKPSQEIKDPKLRKLYTEAIQEGEKRIDQTINSLGERVHGWDHNFNIGSYGTNYLLRAAIAKHVLGANIPEEAVYLKASTDSNGQPLSGNRRYAIHFDKNQIPPVKGFWSITIYDSKTKALVPTPSGRYAVGSNSKLIYNLDSSFDIYIQHKAPKGKESNWLPTPPGQFYLIFRLYIPTEKILQGKYNYPEIKRLQ
jgi:hypothetical protein